MKKLILLSLLVPAAICGMAQTSLLDGVTIVEETYAQKISSNGEWIVGFSVEGGTVAYNHVSGEAIYYPSADYGRGHVVADNGWIVGGQMIDFENSRALVMMDGETFTPGVFPAGVSGNIHSITPDASRICGVVGGGSRGYTNVPYYCDIDSEGNFSELHYLPFPEKDLFGSRPQYCSATWISADGKTIAGQVVDSRGFFVYPIIYTQVNDDKWECSLPSESVFNPEGLPVPEPVQEMEEMYPDVPYPDLENFMTPEEYQNYLDNGSPWDELEYYMSPDEYVRYVAAYNLYLETQEEYQELYEQYDIQYWAIVDSSLNFVRNAMALSADGKWLASSSQYDDLSDPEYPVGYYYPYICDLSSGEWTRFGGDKENYITDQVLEGGLTIVNSLGNEGQPASTYLFDPKKNEFISLLDYLKETNPEYANWFSSNLNDITGQASFSEDMTVLAGGVDGYALNKDMYLSYVLNDLTSGIESIENEPTFEGIYRVFNLQGQKVMETKEENLLRSLPAGLYIINDKKVVVK